MDFQGFVNTFAMPCAVLSIERLSSRHYGKIRIVRANDIYKETMGIARYHDDMIYSDLVPKDTLHGRLRQPAYPPVWRAFSRLHRRPVLGKDDRDVHLYHLDRYAV